ncbi:aminotransferase class V-fold PLP-dependent enzyme [Planctomicrobium sp. SH664]|uniref:aminotransferase class V-fold PLP-dependent enzyme n=1 Tax=Planctomicrobium sp. SH664 TaxID=3448125 RepID=UPI003F5C58DE
MDIAQHWRLEPGVTYLNHGSFGPSPLPIMEARQEWLRQLEAEPMHFFIRRLSRLLDDATEAVARFVNCPADNLIFVPNSTAGMNIVAANLQLEEGDEVLLTDHEYGAVVRIWGQYCQQARAKTTLARLPLPLNSIPDIVESIFERVTPRTRLLVVSHVASQTSVKLPVKEICERARAQGLLVCVDGPHALLMTDIDLQAIPCDFYAAGCHKWLSAPFGSGFLYVRSRFKQGLKPNVISWGRSLDGSPTRWKDEFHWPGTFDPTPYLAIPAAIDFFRQYGVEKFRQETHALTRFARQEMLRISGEEPLFPDDIAWYGSMVSIPFPLPQVANFPGGMHPLQQWLWDQHRIEVPVIGWKERSLVRISCHLYNTRADVERCLDALGEWTAEHPATLTP